MRPGKAKTDAVAKGLIQAALRGTLTQAQARRLGNESPEVLALALLAASKRIADALKTYLTTGSLPPLPERDRRRLKRHAGRAGCPILRGAKVADPDSSEVGDGIKRPFWKWPQPAILPRETR